MWEKIETGFSSPHLNNSRPGPLFLYIATKKNHDYTTIITIILSLFEKFSI